MTQVVTPKHTNTSNSLKRLGELDSFGRLLLEVRPDAATPLTASARQIGPVENGREQGKTAKALGNTTFDSDMRRLRGMVLPEFITPLTMAQLLEQSVGQEPWRFFQKPSPGAGVVAYFQTLKPADVKQLGERMSKLAGHTGIHSGTRETLRKWSRLLIDSAGVGVTQVWRWTPASSENHPRATRAVEARSVATSGGGHEGVPRPQRRAD